MQVQDMILIPLLLQAFGLMFAALNDKYIQKKRKYVMVNIVGLVFLLIAANYMDYYFLVVQAFPLGRIICGVAGYIVRTLILLMFIYLADTERRRYIPLWILVGVNALIVATAFFSRICFTIGSNNRYMGGPLNNSTLITSVILLGYLAWLSFKRLRAYRGALNLITVFNLAAIIASIIADSFIYDDDMRVSFLTIAVVWCSMFYYIWLHLQFVHEHEEALKAEQRIQIMMSQIQPHFLYNTLSTIQALCLTDPKQAFDVTERFGTYLRQNIDSLSQPKLIPFKKELEHTKIYAEIENVRFPDIKIEYDTPVTDFSLPALTVQPLVENAIRHGVRGRKDACVKIITRKAAGQYKILIEDNGKGFDTQAVKAADSSHIGLTNVRERVESMCGGKMTVDSKINQGTVIKIEIPEFKVKESEK